MFNLFGAAKPQLSATDAVAGLASGEITVIDCREANELRASGTAQGGLHVPLALLALKADPSGPDHDKRLDPARPVAVFCASGGRSGMAVTSMMPGVRKGRPATGRVMWRITLPPFDIRIRKLSVRPSAASLSITGPI